MSDDLRVGDVITIPRDQYGRPVYAFDHETRLPTTHLQRFVVTGVDSPVVILRPAAEPRDDLKRAFYKSAQYV